jgi:uncharacterized LabA/DUF88 family protein
MGDQTYLFIDGGHLRKYHAEATQRWFGQPADLDVDQVKQRLSATKCFFYDCVDDIQAAGETPQEFKARVDAQEAWFDKVQALSGTHVRLGSMTGTRKNKRQKQVDILLTVDMMNHAFRRNMALAILITGDQDFKPLVESMVNMGLHVQVRGDRRHTSWDLAAAADSYLPLTLRDYWWWSPEPLKDAFPIAHKHIGNPNLAGYTKLKDVTIDGNAAELFYGGSHYLVRYRLDQDFMVAVHENEQRLAQYCELEFESVTW